MCDFRIIKKIKLSETGEEINIDRSLSISYNDYKNDIFPKKNGLYYVQITGTFRVYWNGESWKEENGSLKYEYDTNNNYLTHSRIENGFDIIESDPGYYNKYYELSPSGSFIL